MDKYLEILNPILFDALITLAVITAALGVTISVWLFFFPRNFAIVEERLSRTISLRRTLRPLEITRKIDHHIYRHHKTFGLLVILASSYSIYQILFHILPAEPTTISETSQRLLIDLFGYTLNLFLLLGNLFAIVVGLVVYIRPSELKGFEARLNRWVSLRRKTRWMDSNIDVMDRLSKSHPRLLGLLIFILCVYLITLISIGYESHLI